MDAIEGYRGIVNGEEIMILGELLMVKSRSRPGVWYEITGMECHCEAASHGAECHHIKNLRGSKEVAEGTGQ